jgi:uncharacterized membrane protein YqiK
VIFVIGFLCVMLWCAQQVPESGTNEAMRVYGRPHHVVGGAVFVLPYIQAMKRLNLEIMAIDVNVEEVYTDEASWSP